jgi:hypothetical protein
MGQPGGALELPHSFGLRLPVGGSAIAPAAPAEWRAWEVVKRARGWHVSRETRDGSKREFVLNEVRRVRIFRNVESAITACNSANRAAS